MGLLGAMMLKKQPPLNPLLIKEGRNESHSFWVVSKFVILRFSKYVTILLFSSIIFSCGSEQKPKKQVVTKPKIEIPTFDEKSAFEFVKKQVDFGPRVPNTKGHKACGKYLVEQLKNFADTVYEQNVILTAFDDTKLQSKNIIASFNPSNNNRILLAAHWDTRPFADQDSEKQNEPILGANDGASGVGVLLEVANVLKAKKPNIGVDIILFDSEDYGQPSNSKLPQKENTYCLGSQYWAKNKHLPNYIAKFGILLDMVGAEGAYFTQEGVSVQYANSVTQKVWKKGIEAGYSSYFSFEKTHPITDDHFYINTLANIPTVDIIHYDYSTESNFPKTWHTHNDKLENIDKNSLKAVGQTLLQVIYSE
jgi:Zn-dependent M28 family amino/carboxypeptidase